MHTKNIRLFFSPIFKSIYMHRTGFPRCHHKQFKHQNVTINISCKKPKDLPACFPHKLIKLSNGAKHWLIMNKTIIGHNGACSWMTRSSQVKSSQAKSKHFNHPSKRSSAKLDLLAPITLDN